MSEDKIKRYIYQVKPNFSSKNIEFKAIGYMFQGENIKNELIELDKNIILEGEEDLVLKDRYKISDEVYIQFYKYNYVDYELATTKSYHIILGSVMYNRMLIIGNLFNFMIDLDITEDTSNIKSFNELTTSRLNGEFKLRLFMDEKNETFDLDIKNINEGIRKILDIVITDNMKNIINLELIKRDEERIKKLGKVNYEIPKKVTNFNDLVNKYKKGDDINKILDEHNYLA